ncbi:tyrosine-protein phosphatase [Spongiibacter sp. KMU-166]|uniref:Tyrosine-protein phosphatase n=1 Tax=Spongiibacter thalassae TaxID=2721624 RepID=A0ABX1GDU2_9GAMM|nr:tyrosine-protein phosphatase [Spongiibacter thalassae]NKI17359.1 tyrosine-protein phosphatase [Spongiibacter thalassae]
MKRSEIINAMHSDELMTQQDIAENRPLPQLLDPEHREALRKLPFDHVHNFRDLGGYLTEDGRRLRWGKLYRSDKLSALSEEDQKYLARLEVKRIVDFRSDDERTNAPHRLLKEHEVRIDPMPITVEAAQVDRVTVRLMQDDVTPADMEQYLVDANREFVANFTPVYREWLHSLLDASSYPQVFHCTAGKDRTGLAAAVVLMALGVHRDVIMNDYLATNTYTAERIDSLLKGIFERKNWAVSPETLRVLFQVQPQFLNAAFELIDEHYGNVDNYLRQGLEFGDDHRQRLADLLLEAE